MSEQRKIVFKRKSPRRKFQFAISVLWKGKYAITEAIEIGEGGLMFYSDRRLAVDDQVVVNFSLPGGATFSSRGLIRYETDPKQRGFKAYGLQFTTLTMEEQRTIRSFVAAKTSEEFNWESDKFRQPKTYVYSVDDSGKAKPTTI